MQRDRDYRQRRNRRVLGRIDKLIADIQAHPCSGIGKSEALRYEWTGYGSRRITAVHRPVVRVDAGIVLIAQSRFHCA